MPKIRLVKITHYYKKDKFYYDFDESIVQSPMSDWQEVSEEDLEKFLKQKRIEKARKTLDRAAFCSII